jgi:small subunit ribosomal protein S4
MANYTGPKVALSRRVGVPIADNPKHTSKRALTPKGMHGARGRRLKDFGIRLLEKQKVRFHFNVSEKQFRKTLDEARRLPGNSGDMLLQLLERRLDNVVRRLGVTRSIWASRQMVAHGHVLVNGKKVDRPSFTVGLNDVISFKPGIHKLCREAMETMSGHEVAGWVEFDPSELRARVVAMPTTDQIPFDCNANLILEFYR